MIAIFSKGPQVLAEVQSRLRSLGYDPVWLSVDEFGNHVADLMSCEAVIVDEVDREFRQSEAVSDLEEWLLCTPAAPPQLFLEGRNDRHLDHRVFPYGNTLVHHAEESLDDEALHAVCHRRLNRHADQLVALT